MSATDWQQLLGLIVEYRDALHTHRTDPMANAEPGMAAENVANLCVRLLLPPNSEEG